MSEFVGAVGGNIATYATVELSYSLGGRNVYTMIDCEKNVLAYETEGTIPKADGKHIFLVEGRICEHRVVDGGNQTVLSECCFELVDHCRNIRGEFFGHIGDIVEFAQVEAIFRRTDGTEWKVTGEFSKVAPKSEYRMVFHNKLNAFVLPYDTQKKLKKDTVGKYFIKGKVIGYTIENGCRATFLYPQHIVSKEGPFYGGGMTKWFAGGWGGTGRG